jgi:hypothetical protein
MSEAAEYAIGAQVNCEDGACGELVRVVVDPVRWAITHLVVELRHGHDVGRLVPIDLVETAAQHAMRLRCTRAEFEELQYAKETEFLPAPDGEFVYPANERLLMPDFGPEDTGAVGGGGPGRLVAGGAHDRVPPGEVEVRRGQRSMHPTVPSGMSVGSSSTRVITT